MKTKSKPKAVEHWFHKAILEGLQKLLSLALEGNPGYEVIPVTAMVWVDTIWPNRAWCEERDLERIQQAFRTLNRISRKWPPPAHFFDVFPRFEQIAQPRLTSVPSEQTRSRSMQEMRDIIDRMDMAERAENTAFEAPLPAAAAK